MVTIVGKSVDPCFICGDKERTVEVKGKRPRFSGTLCMEHLYDRIPDGKEPKGEKDEG